MIDLFASLVLEDIWFTRRRVQQHQTPNAGNVSPQMLSLNGRISAQYAPTTTQCRRGWQVAQKTTRSTIFSGEFRAGHVDRQTYVDSSRRTLAYIA